MEHYPQNPSWVWTPLKQKKRYCSIRQAFISIEQNHPDVSPVPLTPEIIQSKLSLTFQQDKVSQLMAIIDGTPQFSEITDANSVYYYSCPLSTKYNYIKASGRLTCTGIMSDSERATLKALAGTNANFNKAVDAIYALPEDFIKTNFSGVFSSMNAALITLLNHPAQAAEPSIEEKLQLVYNNYLPLLKQKLREDAITQHIASLIGLTEEATAVLIKNDLQSFIDALALEGFSSQYFSDITFTASALIRTDNQVNFNWKCFSRCIGAIE